MSRKIEFRGLNHKGIWVYGIPNLFSTQGDDGVMWSDAEYIYQFSLKTLGQYTGMKDKNGAKIFEGDIVFHYCLGVLQIIFEQGRFLAISEDDELDLHIFKTFKVIGNVWENPELLVV